MINQLAYQSDPYSIFTFSALADSCTHEANFFKKNETNRLNVCK